MQEVKDLLIEKFEEVFQCEILAEVNAKNNYLKATDK
jgi:hypothetical protein